MDDVIGELKTQKDAEIRELKAMIEVLKQRLDELEPKPLWSTCCSLHHPHRRVTFAE